MRISRNAWHYRFMSTMSQDPEKRTNICSYWSGFVQSVLLAVLLLLVFFAALFVFPLAAGSDILFKALSVSSLSWLQLLLSWTVGMSLYAFVVAVIIVFAFVSQFQTSTKNSEPILVAAKWQSFKNKTCTKIDFEK